MTLRKMALAPICFGLFMPLMSLGADSPKWLTLGRSTTLSQALRKQGVKMTEINDLVVAAKKIKNLGMLLPDTRYVTEITLGPISVLESLTLRFSPVESLQLSRDHSGRWVASEKSELVDTRLMTFSGEVDSCLWDSAAKAGMDPSIISALTDIFGWQIDFAREVRPKDSWRLTIEQRFVNNEAIGWGSIMAAEYQNGEDVYSAVLFRKDGEDVGYFTPEGGSLRRLFLKSPIHYSRISSRFRYHRFHPILGINRPHLGVDYAAPLGTPVRAVGDGVVLMAGLHGDAGNTIKIRHSSIYQTAYKHLMGFARGLHAGSHVRQGEVIAYVGQTGLATGPHLHFEFWESGRYVDPMSKRFPSADPVPRKDLGLFKSVAASRLATLPSWKAGRAVSNQAQVAEEGKTLKN